MSYYFISENATYYAIRNGAGLRVMYIPEDIYNNPDRTAMNNVVENVRNTSAKRSTMILPVSNPTKNKADFEIQGLTTTQIDFTQLDEVVLNRISMYTGIPVARLKGIEVGQITSALVNENSYFAVIEKIQYLYKDYLKWCVEKLAELNGIALPDDYDIEYRVRANLSESDQASLMTTKISNLNTLVDNMDRLGISLETAIEMVGLDYVPSVVVPVETVSAISPVDNRPEIDEEQDTEENTDVIQ